MFIQLYLPSSKNRCSEQTVDCAAVLPLSFIFSCICCAQELELVEDVWRGEVQDLLSQITQLQAENKRLLLSLPLKESPVTEEDLQKHEGGLTAAVAFNQSFTDEFLELSG